jgi:aldehyde:ferredoxin oxidoreductase
MMNGWRGKLLRVNLTKGEVKEESLDPQVAKDYIGGRGLGIHYMNKELDPKCDPLLAANLLIMATGPLTGTRAPTGSRYMVMTKSPLTGAITCSNSGGQFPAELKKAGIDMIIFEGKADEPVYLSIDRDCAELRPAKHLWGKTTHETHDAVRRETNPESRVASIGPAGENLVLFASINNERDRAAGRSGVGAVMGSKNLKAVSVVGEGKIPLWDPEAFDEITKKFNRHFRESLKGEKHILNVHGTAYMMATTQSFGILPTRNFQQATFEGWERLFGEALTRRFLVRAKACFSCPIACGRVTKVDDPEFKGEGEGPEYETLYAFGSNCGVDNLAAVTKANYLCNELGLDTITMGATIACAMELYERGYLPETDIGRPLKFGDAKAVVELTRMTGLRKGFGKLLAEGSYRLAQRYGHSELAMVSKKQEFAGYDPRGVQGMGLAYATSPIGASHMRGDPIYSEIVGIPRATDPLVTEGKALLVKDFQDLSAVVDAAGLCIFFAGRYLIRPDKDTLPQGIMELLNAATGAGYELKELARAGERIFNSERLFLVGAGFRRKDDTLPSRMTKEPLTDGPACGKVSQLEEMIEEYYQVRGWSKSGIPTDNKLMELGIS